MKTSGRAFVVVSILLISLLSFSCKMGDLFTPPTATNTATPSPTPTNTFTPSPTATATITPYPTQIPGKFNNPPSHLEQAFSDWGWFTNPHGIRITVFSGFLGILNYNENTIGITFLCDIGEDESPFINEWYPIILKDFVSPATVEAFIEFVETNVSDSSNTITDNINGFTTVLVVDASLPPRTITLNISQQP
jgi:hypothetical protein